MRVKDRYTKLELAGLDRTELPAGATHQIVRDYLVHYGYADTLAAFDSAAGAIPGASGDDMGYDAYAAGSSATLLRQRPIPIVMIMLVVAARPTECRSVA